MSITKRNNKYYCKFQINGERHHYLCKGAQTKAEAERMENAFKYKIQQMQNGVIPREAAAVTFGKLKELYKQYARVNSKRYYNAECNLNMISRFFSNSAVIQNIQPKDIEGFKEWLAGERGLKASSINRYLNTLSKMFTIAVDNKLIKEHPVHSVKKLREPNYKIRFLTAEEEKRLMSVLKEPLKSIVITALQTGMRRGEILNLKWSDIDLEYGFIELLETKSGKSRRIPISKKLEAVLAKQNKDSEYVFVNKETGKPFLNNFIGFRNALKKAGISNFRFHDLRHTAATRMAECNIDLIVIKELLGHSKIETTMRYAHAVPKRKIDAIEVLNSYT